MEKVYCVYRVRSSPFQTNYDLQDVCTERKLAKETKKILEKRYKDNKFEVVEKKLNWLVNCEKYS